MTAKRDWTGETDGKKDIKVKGSTKIEVQEAQPEVQEVVQEEVPEVEEVEVSLESDVIVEKPLGPSHDLGGAVLEVTTKSLKVSVEIEDGMTVRKMLEELKRWNRSFERGCRFASRVVNSDQPLTFIKSGVVYRELKFKETQKKSDLEKIEEMFYLGVNGHRRN